MIDTALAWIDGFTFAIRLMPPENKSWWTPETLMGVGSLSAAFLSAIAAIAAAVATGRANKANAHQAMSARRLEILRISSDNIADLLIIRDRMVWEMRQAQSDIEARNAGKSVPLSWEITKLLEASNEAINDMQKANEMVIQAVFLPDGGAVNDWDDYIRSALLKRQQITHLKSATDLKIAEIRKRAAALHTV